MAENALANLAIGLGRASEVVEGGRLSRVKQNTLAERQAAVDEQNNTENLFRLADLDRKTKASDRNRELSNLKAAKIQGDLDDKEQINASRKQLLTISEQKRAIEGYEKAVQAMKGKTLADLQPNELGILNGAIAQLHKTGSDVILGAGGEILLSEDDEEGNSSIFGPVEIAQSLKNMTDQEAGLLRDLKLRGVDVSDFDDSEDLSKRFADTAGGFIIFKDGSTKPIDPNKQKSALHIDKRAGEPDRFIRTEFDENGVPTGGIELEIKSLADQKKAKELVEQEAKALEDAETPEQKSTINKVFKVLFETMIGIPPDFTKFNNPFSGEDKAIDFGE